MTPASPPPHFFWLMKADRGPSLSQFVFGSERGPGPGYLGTSQDMAGQQSSEMARRVFPLKSFSALPVVHVSDVVFPVAVVSN